MFLNASLKIRLVLKASWNIGNQYRIENRTWAASWQKAKSAEFYHRFNNIEAAKAEKKIPHKSSI